MTNHNLDQGTRQRIQFQPGFHIPQSQKSNLSKEYHEDPPTYATAQMILLGNSKEATKIQDEWFSHACLSLRLK